MHVKANTKLERVVGKADMIEDIILDWHVDRGDNLIWLRV